MILALAVLVMSCKPEARTYPQPDTRDGVIRVPTDALDPGQSLFYSVPMRNGPVNIFVVRVKDRFEAYLDACRKCFVYERGYRGDTGYVECIYCGVTYPVEALSEGLGSCCPIALAAEEKDGFILIRTEDVQRSLASLR